MLGFDVLTNRYVIDARLHAEGGLHIGSGVAGIKTDSPVVRMGNAAYIPGSSLRGILRSTVERFISAVKPDKEYCVTFEPAAPSCHSGEKFRDDLEELAATEDGLRFCPMCQFFGSTAIASRFKITDAIQTAARPKEPVVRDGVGIDRDTETARDQIKYDFEVLEPGCDFRVTFQVENAEDSDKGILYMLLVELKNGVDIGGKRSRGLGRVVLSTDYKVRYFDQDGEFGLAEYLNAGSLKDMPTKAFDDDLRAAFDRFTNPGKENMNVAPRIA